MTSLALAARRMGIRIAGMRIEALAGAALVIAALVAVLLTLVLPSRSAADASTVTVSISPAKASALIEATTGEGAVEMSAIGDRAKLINASLPFASGPVQAARPFAVSGSDSDQRRALLCLTQAVYYEAGFEPLDGRRAVAQVVLNRMRHPAFPKSICGVVYQNNGRICQFTFVCDGALNRAPARGAWEQAEAIARSALAGYVELRVGAATHYHADYVAPRWAPMLAKVSQLGQHIFYRWPGAWGQVAAFSGRYAGEPRDPQSMRPILSVAATDDAGAVLTGQPVVSGPLIARAENDVGGLLDTSKGWTLNIPGPDEIGSAAKTIAAQQGHRPAVTELAKTATPGPAVASR